MASTHGTTSAELVDDLARFLRREYREEIARTVQTGELSVTVAHTDLYSFDPDIADDAIEQPARVRKLLGEAAEQLSLPVPDVEPGDLNFRIGGLTEPFVQLPDEIRPSEDSDRLRAVRGEVSKATQRYGEVQVGAFECQRCGHTTRVPMRDGEWREPHECRGCERQGPFQLDQRDSEWRDVQKFRVQTPPEEARGDSTSIDGYIRGDLAGELSPGDRAVLTGQITREQQGTNSVVFEPQLEAQVIEWTERDAEELDISDEERDRIRALANGAEGEPLQVAANSIATDIFGYEHVKKAIIMALVGGVPVRHPTDKEERGQLHILLIGDPSTGKSKLIDSAAAVGYRSVPVSGTGASKAGLLATATKDDFGDGNAWTLEAGAAVQANKGTLAIDELDDMDEEVRASLLEPMSKQRIDVSKAGISASFETKVSVVAAANPKQGRFDRYEPIIAQFEFGDTLLSRFDLVYTFEETYDPDQDERVAEHILTSRDEAKRHSRGELPAAEMQSAPAIDHEILRKWIGYAKQQPNPVFADDAVQAELQDRHVTLRSMHDYDEDKPVPVTHRSLEAAVRIAEAAARFELSETIEQRHVDIATGLVGQSMQDIGMDPETEQFDADIKESGRSKSQAERRGRIADLVQQLQREHEGGAPVAKVVEKADADEGVVRSDIQHFKNQGKVWEPKSGCVRWVDP